jgi:hypothetical protein
LLEIDKTDRFVPFILLTDRSIGNRFVPFVLLTDRSIGEQDIKGKRGRKAKSAQVC